MIIDRISLAGLDAYLLDSDPTKASDPNLASTPANYQGNHTGVLKTFGEGRWLETNSLYIHLEAADLSPLFSRQPQPLLRLNVNKEMFPRLYADPYKHRVHTVGGYEDLERGKSENVRVMEVGR